LTIPDTCKIASAYGLRNMKILNHDGIRKHVEEALETKGPIICEVMVDPLSATVPRLSSEVRPDGSIVSKPMEDLWPFLDRKEFYANMIIPTLKI